MKIALIMLSVVFGVAVVVLGSIGAFMGVSVALALLNKNFMTMTTRQQLGIMVLWATWLSSILVSPLFPWM